MKKVRFGGRLLAALLLPFVVVACSDTTGLEENHGEEIEGVQIWLSGAMIASYDGDTGSWTGELEVHEGEETAHMDIRMVCLLYTSPSPRDLSTSRMPSSA